MTQMKLIANSRDEWTVKELLETMHEKVNDLEQKLESMHDYNKARFEAMQSMLQAIVLRITDPGAALYTHVLAMEPTVVPNEDEGMPVVADPSWQGPACCPQCDTKADTLTDIADFFGWRKMENGKTIVQSWCRECRSSGKHKTEPVAEPVVEPVIVQDEPAPRKCMPLPTDIADVGREARKLKKEAAALAKKAAAASPKHQPDLLRQAASKAEESTKKQSQYNQERGQFRPRPPKPGKGNK